MISFAVPGTPIGKGRPKFTTVSGRAMAYTPGKTVAYEGEIARAGRAAMGNACPFIGPVEIDATAVFPIPDSWSKRKKAAAKYHTSRPDADNVAKALGDGLNGIVWKDDSQIAAMRLAKLYGDKPGLYVTVTAL